MTSLGKSWMKVLSKIVSWKMRVLRTMIHLRMKVLSTMSFLTMQGQVLSRLKNRMMLPSLMSKMRQGWKGKSTSPLVEKRSRMALAAGAGRCWRQGPACPGRAGSPGTHCRGPTVC